MTPYVGILDIRNARIFSDMSKIYITQFDYDRLKKLLDKKRPHDDFDKALLIELDRGEIVESKDIPPDVITMNSHVRFMDEAGHDWDYWVVFPEDTDLAQNKISILSPIGCALLGRKIGDKVTLHTPKQGERDLIVEEILSQPEREGKLDL
jgi:regulator of nucleoside diphosphate kinase